MDSNDDGLQNVLPASFSSVIVAAVRFLVAFERPRKQIIYSWCKGNGISIKAQCKVSFGADLTAFVSDYVSRLFQGF